MQWWPWWNKELDINVITLVFVGPAEWWVNKSSNSNHIAERRCKSLVWKAWGIWTKCYHIYSVQTNDIVAVWLQGWGQECKGQTANAAIDRRHVKIHIKVWTTYCMHWGHERSWQTSFFPVWADPWGPSFGRNGWPKWRYGSHAESAGCWLSETAWCQIRKCSRKVGYHQSWKSYGRCPHGVR